MRATAQQVQISPIYSMSPAPRSPTRLHTSAATCLLHSEIRLTFMLRLVSLPAENGLVSVDRVTSPANMLDIASIPLSATFHDLLYHVLKF